MSYVKTTWVTGDIVTAPKLNNLESGVEANDLNKLNKPSGNGTAGQLLISNGDGSTSWTDTDTTLEESGKAADAKVTGDGLGTLRAALNTIGVAVETVDFTEYDVINGTMQANGQWAGINGDTYQSTLVTAIAYNITVVAQDTHNAYISFFNKVPTQPAGEAQQIYFCDGETGRHTINAGTSEDFEVPSDCKCIVVTTKSGGTDYTPQISERFKADGLITDLNNDKADVVVNTANGAIASFTDGAAMSVKSLTVDVDAVQDLHGYNNPWPAGGNVNKFGEGTVTPASGSASYGLTVTVDLTAGTIHVTGTPTWTTTGNKQFRLFQQSGSYAASYKAKYFVVSKSANISNISTDSFAADASAYMAIQINVTDTNAVDFIVLPMVYAGATAPTEYSPYSNICPITGWDAVKVTRTGKNLWNTDDIAEISTGSVNRNGCRFNISGTYTITARDTGGYLYARIFNADGTTKTTYYIVATTVIIPATFTIANGEYFVVYDADAAATLKQSKTHFNKWKCQVELNSVVTPYEPYNGQSVTIQLGQTVYGGTLNVNTGVLTVDKAVITLDNTVPVPLPNWRPKTGYSAWLYSLSLTDIKNDYGTTVVPDMIASSLPTITYIAIFAGTEAGISIVDQSLDYGIVVRVAEEGLTTEALIQAWLANNPITVVYPLKTSITVQLTAEQLSTIKGTNNIFADTGDVSVEYGADTKLYIEDSIVTPSLSMIAPIENGTTASQAYTTGQYFLHNNVFCKAKTNIASGATFTLNTNYEETTIAAELYTALH